MGYRCECHVIAMRGWRWGYGCEGDTGTFATGAQGKGIRQLEVPQKESILGKNSSIQNMAAHIPRRVEMGN